MMKATPYTALAILLIGTATAQAQTQVPNQFSAGQPAIADEVNANFGALEEGVNQNSTAIQDNAANIEQISSTILGIEGDLSAAQNNVASLDALIEANSSAIQANQEKLEEVQGALLDTRAGLVDRNGVEVGRVMFVDGSGTFVIDVSVDGYRGVLHWNPATSGTLTLGGNFQSGDFYYNASCGDGSATAISSNPYLLAGGLVPVVGGQLYAIDRSSPVSFVAEYVNTGASGCTSDVPNPQTVNGYSLVSLGEPWTQPFQVQ